jgi:microcystin-dependent protein/non-homologous end joining protein Ku
MSVYNQPLESLSQFNTKMFGQPDDPLTQEEASLIYQTIAGMTNYVNRTGNVTEDINGIKTFLNTLYLSNGIRYYNTTNYTDFAQVGTQLTIKPVSLNGSLALYSSAPSTGIQTRQLLLDNTGLNSTTLTSTNIFSSNYGTTTSTGQTDFCFGTTSGIVSICSQLTSGSVRIGNSSGSSNCYIYNTLNANGMLANTPSVNQNIFTNLTSSGSITIGNALAPITINSSTNTIGGSTTFTVIPNCSVTATSANQLVNYTTLTGQSYTTLPIIQANANAWTNTNTFNSFLPTSTITATSANQLVNYTTLTSQGYTTLSLIQANNNIWTGTNQYNQPIKIQYASTQFTNLDQTAQVFSIQNKSTGGNIRFECRTSPGLVDTPVAIFNTTGISLGTNAGSNSITGNSTTFDHGVSITGTLTAGNISLTNTISGPTTFNQTASFTVIPTTTINANANNQIVNWQTLNGQSFTTLALVQSNNNAFTGTNTFNTSLPTSTISATTANQLVNFTTLNAQSFTTLALVQANNNTWTGTNAFNTSLPTSTISATTANQLVNFTTLNAQSFTTLALVQANNNTWTGTNAFNTSLPTSTISATTANQLVNFTTLNAQSFTTLALVQANNNTWTGTNAFNTSLPTSTISATTANQLVNFTTLNAQSFVKPSSNNIWTGTNSFNTSIPTTNITATTASEIVNFTTLNAQSFVKPSSNNTWTGTNSFNTSIPTTSISATSANELVNYTTLTSQSYTTLSAVQANANTFTNTNTFSNVVNLNGQLNLKNNFVLYDLALPNTNYLRIYQSGNDISFSPTGGSNTNYYFSALNSGGTSVNILQLTSSNVAINGNASITGLATFSNGAVFNTVLPTTSITATLSSQLVNFTTLTSQGFTTIANILANANTWTNTNIFNSATTFANNTTYSAATINLNSSTATHDTNLFSSITSGTHGYLSNLSNNAVVNMFSSATSDVNLNINAKVKFRQVKLYNQVKTTTGATPLTFPLEENVVINSSTTATITLPAITANSLGMTFNFIKNNVNAVITFTAQGTNTIIKNGSTTGTTSAILLNTGITSIQLTILEYVSGTYNWVVINSSLPQQISNPVGSIITMSVNSLPTGYLFCNGASVSTTTYADLFAVIAYTYGGSGASFQVPFFNNGVFLRGFGGSSLAIGSYQADAIADHTHDFTYNTVSRGSSASNTVSSIQTSGGANSVTTTSHNLTSSTETRPENYAVYYCIKY